MRWGLVMSTPELRDGITASDEIPDDLVEEIALRLLRFSDCDLENEYAREIIRLVLQRSSRRIPS
jgi:hypothetical protein